MILLICHGAGQRKCENNSSGWFRFRQLVQLLTMPQTKWLAMSVIGK
jgi:hypothetical protein